MKSTTIPLLGRGLALSLISVPLAASLAAQDKAPVTASAATNFDAAKTPWVAPVKDGLHAIDPARLPLEQRSAADRALARIAPAGDGAATDKTAALERVRRNDSRGHFQIDATPEGDVWVFGGTYKAHFAADGASYIPSFGSAAPRNFPLTFRVREAMLGGARLPLDFESAPILAGERIEYDRVALRERYDVALGRVEQSFVFDTLPSAGPLELLLSVATELGAEATADGLSFGNEHGRVDYSRAVAIDAVGQRSVLETTAVAGGVRISVSEEFLRGATLPLIVDPVLTTWAPNLGATDDFSADIAYDAVTNRFLVVYERAFSATDHDVWGELFEPATGAAVPGSGAYVDFTSAYWEAPRCANNRIATQFLVVATRRGAPDEIWGRTREAEDTTQGNQFQVSSGPGAKLHPDVGGDPETSGPTYYCVVWERAFAPGADHDIHAQLVSTSSAQVGAVPILIDNSSNSYDKWPTISKHNGLAPFSSQAWNIVWSRQFNAVDWDVRGSQVLWNGTVLTPSFSVDFSSNDHRFPEVSSSLAPTAEGRMYLATYEQWTASRVEVAVKLLSGASVRDGQNLSVTFATPAGLNDITPAVETDGGQFAVTWSQQYQPGSGDYDMYACTFYTAGSRLHVSDLQTNLAFSSSYEGNGRVASLYGAGFTSNWLGVVWTDSAGAGNVEAATYFTPDGFGVRIGSRYCSPAVPNSTGNPGRIDVSGSNIAGGLPLHLAAYQLPNNVFCYFLGSPASAATTTPATSGVVCVGNPLSRFNAAGQIGNTGSSGRVQLDVDVLAVPRPTGGTFALAAGTTFHFQAWYRDGATNNLTDAVAVSFQ